MPAGFFKSRIISSSADDTWRTPKLFFDNLSREFTFGLDAAASKASTMVPANWYGPDHPDKSRRDGLITRWSDDTDQAVWLNPPYGSGITRRWLEKANDEARNGIDILCLIPSRTSTLWFHDLCFPHRIRFIKRKLKFNENKNAAPFDSALVWIRKDSDPGYF